MVILPRQHQNHQRIRTSKFSPVANPEKPPPPPKKASKSPPFARIFSEVTCATASTRRAPARDTAPAARVLRYHGRRARSELLTRLVRRLPPDPCPPPRPLPPPEPPPGFPLAIFHTTNVNFGRSVTELFVCFIVIKLGTPLPIGSLNKHGLSSSGNDEKVSGDTFLRRY